MVIDVYMSGLYETHSQGSFDIGYTTYVGKRNIDGIYLLPKNNKYLVFTTDIYTEEPNYYFAVSQKGG